MLILQLLIGLFLMFGAGDALTTASPVADEVSLGEEQVEYQRPPKDDQPQPHPVTWGELKGMLQ